MFGRLIIGCVTVRYTGSVNPGSDEAIVRVSRPHCTFLGLVGASVIDCELASQSALGKLGRLPWFVPFPVHARHASFTPSLVLITPACFCGNRAAGFPKVCGKTHRYYVALGAALLGAGLSAREQVADK